MRIARLCLVILAGAWHDKDPRMGSPQLVEKLGVMFSQTRGYRFNKSCSSFDFALDGSLRNEEEIANSLEPLFAHLHPVLSIVDKQYAGATIEDDRHIFIDGEALRNNLVFIKKALDEFRARAKADELAIGEATVLDHHWSVVRTRDVGDFAILKFAETEAGNCADTDVD